MPNVVPAKHPGGRPCEFTQETADAICERLAKGESLRSICRDEDMPSRDAVFDWIEKFPEFSDQYAKARDVGIDNMADECLTIADDGTNDWVEKFDKDGASAGYMLNTEHVQRSRLRVDTRKWYLSKLAPKRYGERLEVTGAGGKDLIPESDSEIARRLLFMLTAGVKQENADG